ncbi:MAG: hypothetical protein ABH811_00420 [archaeon]
MGLIKYLIKDRNSSTFDIDKLMEFPDEEFMNLHIQSWNDYYSNYVRTTGNKPLCDKCKKEVNPFEELNEEPEGIFHINCFRDTYLGKKNNFSEKKQKYFERIIRVFAN